MSIRLYLCFCFALTSCHNAVDNDEVSVSKPQIIPQNAPQVNTIAQQNEKRLREQQIAFFGDQVKGRPLRVDPVDVPSICFENGACFDFKHLPEPWYLSVRRAGDVMAFNSATRHPPHFTIVAPMDDIADMSWFGESKSIDYDYSPPMRRYIKATIFPDESGSFFHILDTGRKMAKKTALPLPDPQRGQAPGVFITPYSATDLFAYFGRRYKRQDCPQFEYSIIARSVSHAPGKPFENMGRSYIVGDHNRFSARVVPAYIGLRTKTPYPVAQYSSQSIVQSEFVLEDGTFIAMGFSNLYAPITPEIRCEVEGVVEKIRQKRTSK